MDYAKNRWWLATESLLASETIAAARAVDMATSTRRMQMLEAYCLYGDETAVPENVIELRSQPTVTRNVLALAVDTVISEVTQARPRPMFVTVGVRTVDPQSLARPTLAHPMHLAGMNHRLPLRIGRYH